AGSAGGTISIVGKRMALPPACSMRRARLIAWWAGRVTRTPIPRSVCLSGLLSGTAVSLFDERAGAARQQLFRDALAKRLGLGDGTVARRLQNLAALRVADQRAQMQGVAM